MKKVVVVDDDEDMQALIVMLLRENYAVEVAGDGAEGLALVQRTHPDLVVLDLLMPKMHGFEVCQRIRADKELDNTKILISSSKSYQHDVNTAVGEAGADGYIVKPFDVGDFRRRVDALLGAA